MFRMTFFVGDCSVCSIEHVERCLRDLGGIDPSVNLNFPFVSFINGCMFRSIQIRKVFLRKRKTDLYEVFCVCKLVSLIALPKKGR